MICNLQRKYGTSVIMITHDLGVVAETCDKVAIMYAGEVVEYGNTGGHLSPAKVTTPTRWACSARIPNLDTRRRKRLHPIEGLMPDPTEPAGGLQVRSALSALHGAVPKKQPAACL